MNFQNISSHGHKSLAASLKKKKKTTTINKQTNQPKKQMTGVKMWSLGYVPEKYLMFKI